MLTAEQIHNNWIAFRDKINLFPGREAELNQLYDTLEERIMMMPASGTEYYHNAFAGGYVDHVLRVMDCAETLYEVWKAKGADVSGFTLEELLFAAMHHDLGKAGFPGPGQEVYLPNDSEWHRKNQGKIYKHNPNIPFTLVPDLSIWTLQHLLTRKKCLRSSFCVCTFVNVVFEYSESPDGSQSAWRWEKQRWPAPNPTDFSNIATCARTICTSVCNNMCNNS
jgi:hypothetical protein